MTYKSKSFDINLLSEENVKKYVLPKYNLQNTEVYQIKFKNTDKQRAIYKVVDENKTYCLKKVYFDKSELLFVYSAIEWLYRYGINVPRILPTKDRNRFVNYNNMLFILTPWVLGDKCDYDDKKHVIKSIENLSNMHYYCKNFTPIKGGYRKEKKDILFKSYKKHFYQLIKCSNYAFKCKDKFSDIFLESFDKNLFLANISVQISSTIQNFNLKRCLCHLDYVNKNIIVDYKNNIWTIDFDKCAIEYRVHDISYFLRRLLRRSSTNWDVDLTIDVLNSYDKKDPLTFDEYKYILSYLCFPQKFWKISKDYYNNIKKCNKHSFQKILNKSTENINNQMNFVYKFSKHIENKFNKSLIDYN